MQCRLSDPGTSSDGGRPSLSVSGNVTVDGIVPIVLNVTSSNPAAAPLGLDDPVTVRVAFDEIVFVDGTPLLELEMDGENRKAAYASGNNSTTLTFAYTVQRGDSATDLDYAGRDALELDGGAIRDLAGNGANLTLPEPGSPPSLAGSADVMVAGGSGPAAVKVGALMAGGMQEFGDDDRTRVLEYAAAQFNGTGDGVRLDIDMINITRGDEAAALVAAYAGGAGPRLYIGPTTSQGLTNILDNADSRALLDNGDVLLVSPSSEAPQLAAEDDGIFRLAFNVARQGDMLVDEIKSAGISSYIVVARDDAWGRQLAASVHEKAGQEGLAGAGQILFDNNRSAEYWNGISNGIATNVSAAAVGAGEKVGVLFLGYDESYPDMAAAANGSAAIRDGTAWFVPSSAGIDTSSRISNDTVRDFSAAVGLTALSQDVEANPVTAAIDGLFPGRNATFYEYSTYDSAFVLGSAARMAAAAGGGDGGANNATMVKKYIASAAMNYTGGALGDGLLLDANGDLLAPDSFTVHTVVPTGEWSDGRTVSSTVTLVGALLALDSGDYPDNNARDALLLAAADYNAAADRRSFVKLVTYNITDPADPNGYVALDVLERAHAGGEGPSAYIGPSLSSNVQAVMDYIGDNNILLIGYGSESEELSIPGDNLFRTAVSTDRHGRLMAQVMADAGVRSVVTVVRDDSWGLSYNASIADALGPNGLRLAGAVKFAEGGADWGPTLDAISAAVAADAGRVGVAFVGTGGEQGSVAAAALANSTASSVQWFVSPTGFYDIANATEREFARAVNLTAIVNDIEGNDKKSSLDGRVGVTLNFYDYAAYDALFILGNTIASVVESGKTSGIVADDLRPLVPAQAGMYGGVLGDIALNSNGDLRSPDRFAVWQVDRTTGMWANTGVTKSTPVLDIGALLVLDNNPSYVDDRERQAMDAAVDDFNAGREMIGDFYIDLEVQRISTEPNTGSPDPDALAGLMNAYANGDGPSLYIGPSASGNAERVLGYANNNNIVLLSHASTAPRLAIAGDNLFRLVPTDSRQGVVLGDIIARNASVTDLVMAVRDDAWGRGVNSSTTARLGGGVDITRVSFAAANPDWTDVGQRLGAAVDSASTSAGSKTNGKAAVLFIGFAGDFIEIAAQSRTTTSLASVTWFGPNGVGNNEGILANATALAFARNVSITTVIFAVAENDINRRLAGLGADYGPSAYDSVFVMGNAMKAALDGGIAPPLDVKAAIPGAALSYSGALGNITLDGNGDLLSPSTYGVYTIGPDDTWVRDRIQDAAAGDGDTRPPGNNVTMPPGNNVTMPPGNNVTMPPGNNVTMSLSVEHVASNGRSVAVFYSNPASASLGDYNITRLDGGQLDATSMRGNNTAVHLVAYDPPLADGAALNVSIAALGDAGTGYEYAGTTVPYNLTVNSSAAAPANASATVARVSSISSSGTEMTITYTGPVNATAADYTMWRLDGSRINVTGLAGGGMATHVITHLSVRDDGARVRLGAMPLADAGSGSVYLGGTYGINLDSTVDDPPPLLLADMVRTTEVRLIRAEITGPNTIAVTYSGRGIAGMVSDYADLVLSPGGNRTVTDLTGSGTTVHTLTFDGPKARSNATGTMSIALMDYPPTYFKGQSNYTVRDGQDVPYVYAITTNATGTSYTAGSSIYITIEFSEPVDIGTDEASEASGGTTESKAGLGFADNRLYLLLNTNRTAGLSQTYSGGTLSYEFVYYVQEGDDSDGYLDYMNTTSLVERAGAAVRNIMAGTGTVGNRDANLTLPAVGSPDSLAGSAMLYVYDAPRVAALAAPAGQYNAGDQLSLTANLSRSVTVYGAAPSLELGSPAARAAYDSGNGTDSYMFNYTVRQADTLESLLRSVAIVVPGGSAGLTTSAGTAFGADLGRIEGVSGLALPGVTVGTGGQPPPPPPTSVAPAAPTVVPTAPFGGFGGGGGGGGGRGGGSGGTGLLVGSAGVTLYSASWDCGEAMIRIAVNDDAYLPEITVMSSTGSSEAAKSKTQDLPGRTVYEADLADDTILSIRAVTVDGRAVSTASEVVRTGGACTGEVTFAQYTGVGAQGMMPGDAETRDDDKRQLDDDDDKPARIAPPERDEMPGDDDDVDMPPPRDGDMEARPAFEMEAGRDASYYVKRYAEQADYRAWFDASYPQYDSICEAVGAAPGCVEAYMEEQAAGDGDAAPPPMAAECAEGMVMRDGECVEADAPPPAPAATTDDDSGCLIATAAYGTELAPQVQALREVRDATLLSTGAGSAFMSSFSSAYYAFSPHVADLEREVPAFRQAVGLFLTPMVYALQVVSLAEPGSESDVLAYGIAAIALVAGMYVAAPAAGAWYAGRHVARLCRLRRQRAS